MAAFSRPPSPAERDAILARPGDARPTPPPRRARSSRISREAVLHVARVSCSITDMGHGATETPPRRLLRTRRTRHGDTENTENPGIDETTARRGPARNRAPCLTRSTGGAAKPRVWRGRIGDESRESAGRDSSPTRPRHTDRLLRGRAGRASVFSVSPWRNTSSAPCEVSVCCLVLALCVSAAAFAQALSGGGTGLRARP